MPKSNHHIFLFLVFITLSFSSSLQANTQEISVLNNPKGLLGSTVNIEVAYETTNSNNNLSGIGFRLHFDSSVLTFTQTENILANDLIANAGGPISDESNYDNDDSTDSYVTFGWASLSGNWPDETLPAKLFDAIFVVSRSIDTSKKPTTSINFTSTSTAVGYGFKSQSFQMQLVKASWDFDGNGHADALTDGLLLLRHTFQVNNENLTKGIVAEDSPLSSEEIVQLIQDSLFIADIDGDGNVDALTDALILLRYLFELRDDDLTHAVITENATRTESSDIEDYLQIYMPVESDSNLDYESAHYENLAGTWHFWPSRESYDAEVIDNSIYMEVVFSRFGHVSYFYQDSNTGYVVDCFGDYTLNESELNAMLGCREGDVFYNRQISGSVIDETINLDTPLFSANDNLGFVNLYKDGVKSYNLTNIQSGIYDVLGISNLYIEISASGEVSVTDNNGGGCDINGYIKTDPSYGLTVQNFNEIPLIDTHEAILDIENCYYDDNFLSYSNTNINDSEQPVILRSIVSGVGHQIVELFAQGNSEVDNVVNAFWLSLSLVCGNDEDCSHVINGDDQLVSDGVAPIMNEATVLNKCNMTPVVALGDTITITLNATESILRPSVTIAGNEVRMFGQHHQWTGEYFLDDAGELEHGDEITLRISYADNSGMNGSDITEADDGSLQFCDSEVATCQCLPDDISGVWRNANKIGSMGVGPYEGDISYWSIDDFELGRRDCVFDDTYTFIKDDNAQSGGGIFSQEMNSWTWLESWASPDGLESCGDPTQLENYPFDGLETGHTYKWDPEGGKLTVIGEGAHIGIPRIINDGEANVDGYPANVVYKIATASNCFISMNILSGNNLWYHFELERIALADGTPVSQEFCGSRKDGDYISDLDLFGPEITISGTNPLIIRQDAEFTVPEATFVDAFDTEQNEAPQNTIKTISNVNTSVTGTYTVTYTATDNSGNETTATLSVFVLPNDETYRDEIVLFRNGNLAEGWVLNGYDVDLSYGACPDNSCPNLDYGIETDPDRGDVIYIDQGIDNEKQAAFFMQVTDLDRLDDSEVNDPVDLSGAAVNGKLSFDVWSESPDGVDLNVAVDCPAYPASGDPILLEGVGAQQWQEVSIPASALFNEACALRSDEIGTIPMFLTNWIGPKIRIDNVVWSCEFSCESPSPDPEYTEWVKVDKTKGYDAPTSYPGYQLVWSDEFDGTEVDTTKWNLIDAGGGFGNNELQYYRPANASVANGLLEISVEIQKSDDPALPGGESFSSAKLTTQDLFEFKHGRVDIRAVVAEGKGFWSAGWMLGANFDDIGWPFSGEIDIFDTIGGTHYGVDQEPRMLQNAYWNAQGPNAPGQSMNPRQYETAVYSPTSRGQNLAWGERVLDDGNTFSDTFHVFSIEWDEEKIRYMIDGEYVAGKDLDLTTGGAISACPHGQTPNGPQLSCVGQSFDNDFFLILNVAVGGFWAGLPDETTQFPRGMLVDYVRVYQTQN